MSTDWMHRLPLYRWLVDENAQQKERIAALEAEVKTLEMTLDGVKALYEQRSTALDAAARGVYACVVGSANEPDPPSMMSQVCRVMRRTTQFERLAALLEEEAT